MQVGPADVSADQFRIGTADAQRQLGDDERFGRQETMLCVLRIRMGDALTHAIDCLLKGRSGRNLGEYDLISVLMRNQFHREIVVIDVIEYFNLRLHLFRASIVRQPLNSEAGHWNCLVTSMKFERRRQIVETHLERQYFKKVGIKLQNMIVAVGVD